MTEHENLSPNLFVELCNPAWSKVYNELNHGRQAINERLHWSSKVVRDTFINLAGFDPAKVQYAGYDQQRAALNAARELESAIYQADEIEELDGQPALQFGLGWMSACTWMQGADTSSPPPEDAVDLTSRRFAQSLGVMPADQFVKGFKKRIELGHSFVA